MPLKFSAKGDIFQSLPLEKNLFLNANRWGNLVLNAVHVTF
jgi:hypothetical protein